MQFLGAETLKQVDYESSLMFFGFLSLSTVTQSSKIEGQKCVFFAYFLAESHLHSRGGLRHVLGYGPSLSTAA